MKPFSRWYQVENQLEFLQFRCNQLLQIEGTARRELWTLPKQKKDGKKRKQKNSDYKSRLHEQRTKTERRRTFFSSREFSTFFQVESFSQVLTGSSTDDRLHPIF